MAHIQENMKLFFQKSVIFSEAKTEQTKVQFNAFFAK